MTMQRIEDWPERLAAYLAERSSMAFEWGANDCVTFALGAAHAITGEWVVPVTWTNEAAAIVELDRRGGLEAALNACLPAVPVQQAMRGDVVLVQFGDARWLAVCDGALAWTARVGERLGAVPMRLAVAAWKVG